MCIIANRFTSGSVSFGRIGSGLAFPKQEMGGVVLSLTV